jgi:hypothetical protein
VDDGLVRAARGGPRYLTNDLGDIDRVDDGGVIKPFDPSVWNWYVGRIGVREIVPRSAAAWIRSKA